MKAADSGPGYKLLAMLLMVVLLFAGMTAGLRLLQEHVDDSRLFSVLINDQQLILDGTTLTQFNADLSRLSAQQRRHADVYIQQWLDRWLDDSFALAHQALPAYLDWYYSMPGSYSRLYHALSGDLDGHLERRLGSHLLEQSGLEARLAALESELNAELTKVLGEQAGVVRRQLLGIYAQQQREPSVNQHAIDFSLNVDAALERGFSPSDADRQRWQISSQASVVAGTGAFVLLARRALVPRLMALSSVQGARRVLAGFAVRLAPRMALAISAGGSAAAVTAPTGPGALVAGGVAFVTAAGTIVITDFALLKAEEVLLRDEKQQQISDELLASQIALREQLRVQLQEAGSVSQALIQHSLARSYDQAGVEQRFHIFARHPPNPAESR
ncbi:hypothetical protein [Halopseudomonas pelagia]|uniref:hypothetical protein n=1 Tax=Halopseudomonas pelagia TaxID=553151 RepID=UPI00039DB17D|nr:hypothetical protein [Halopseudomonas pelagia]